MNMKKRPHAVFAGKNTAGAGKFLLLGGGLDFINDMTLATVSALRACDVVFYMHGDTERCRSTLHRICPEVRIEFLEGYKMSRLDIWRKIAAELKKGRRVAHFTYGHPLLINEGVDLLHYCRRDGYAFRVVPALTAADNLLAMLAEHGYDARTLTTGFSVRWARELLSPSFSPSSNLTMLFDIAEEIKLHGKKLLLSLERCYPPAHPVYLARCADYMTKPAFTVLKVKDLSASIGRIKHRMTLLLPPLAAAFKEPAKPVQSLSRRPRATRRRLQRHL